MKHAHQIITASLIACLSIGNACAEIDVKCIKRPANNLDEQGKPFMTKLGLLEQYSCPDDSGILTDQPEYLLLAGRQIIKEKNLVGGTFNAEKNIFLYTAGDIRESLLGGCSGTQYLLDLRGKNPRLFRFGIKDACNQIDQITWKKDGVTINFNLDARFRYLYSSNKMLPPKDDPDRYDPLFDENSPAFTLYHGKPKHPHMKYQLAPPYIEEVNLEGSPSRSNRK